MPDNSLSIVIECGSLGVTEPRKALAKLKPLKEKFLREGSYENLEDFAVYNAVVSMENIIHGLNNRYSYIYRSLNNIQTNIKPMLRINDDYALIYFSNKIEILAYKAQEKGDNLHDNPRYRGNLQKIKIDVKKFEFKTKLTQNALIAILDSYL